MEKKKITNAEFRRAVAAYADAWSQHQRRLRLLGAQELVKRVRDKLYDLHRGEFTAAKRRAIFEDLEVVSAAITESWLVCSAKGKIGVLLGPVLVVVLDRREWDDGTHETRPVTKALKAVLDDAGIECNDYAPTRHTSWHVFIDDVLKRIVDEFTAGWTGVSSSVARAVNNLAQDRGWETRLRAGSEGVEDISGSEDSNRPCLWVCQDDDGAVWYTSSTGTTIARFVSKRFDEDYGVTIWHHKFAVWDGAIGTPAGERIHLDFAEAEKFNWATLTM